MSSAQIRHELPDVHRHADARELLIHEAGVDGLLHPVHIHDRDTAQIVTARFRMGVRVPASAKGAHMSRFVALLGAEPLPVALGELGALHARMLTLLEADAGRIEMRFRWFRRKQAPVTAVESLLDYGVRLEVAGEPGASQLRLGLEVPVTSLCPCSKEISAFGAHNQRSLLSLDAVLASPLPEAFALEDLVARMEDQGSAQLYGLLKRPDEKHVTEQAYQNPKFVEDLVRDLALALRGQPGLARFAVEVENIESIHNHSAVARIEWSA